MSKRNSLVMTLLLVTGLLALSIFSSYSTAAPQRKGVVVAASNAKNAAIISTSAAVLKETSAIRELAILQPVKSGAQSRAEIERMVIRNLDEQTTPAQMRATELTLKKLGMVPPDFAYRSFLIKLLTEQVAGYYDPRQQHFFIADWIDLEGQRPVMAHELTHALQDQHFNLRRFEHWPRGESDAELAAHALIEGDATLAMKVYMAKNPLIAFAFIRAFGPTAMSSKEYEQAPRSLRESLVFPYEQGLEWATAVFRKGGWPAVSQAFAELPQSSEQILHPEKYFAKEAPVKVTLPDLRAELGSGWKRIDYDVNGEWAYYLILDQFLNVKAESQRAAAGWGGDRYEVYQGANPDQVLIAQLSVWDTEHDASEFFDAYIKRTGIRYAAAKAITQGPTSDSRRQWTTAEGGVLIELTGKRVLIVEGIPNTADSQRLVKSLWR